MNINKLIKNAKSVDPFADIPSAQKQEAILKGKLAAIIFNKRMELNMTQTEFAKHLGVSQSLVSKWEDGEYNFTVEKISEVATKLGISLDITAENANNSVRPSKQEVFAESYSNSKYSSSKRNHFFSSSSGNKNYTVFAY